MLAEAVAKGLKLTPRAYLQGVLDSPGSTKTEKMRAAELLMKCPPEALPSTTARRSCLEYLGAAVWLSDWRQR